MAAKTLAVSELKQYVSSQIETLQNQLSILESLEQRALRPEQAAALASIQLVKRKDLARRGGGQTLTSLCHEILLNVKQPVRVHQVVQALGERGHAGTNGDAVRDILGRLLKRGLVTRQGNPETGYYYRGVSPKTTTSPTRRMPVRRKATSGKA